uniref:Uncharacterized protein n=1 Tax=Rhizophora mucronata TaxID=61149 RepID=A0A2P2QBM4_RHIMU
MGAIMINIIGTFSNLQMFWKDPLVSFVFRLCLHV